MDQRREQLLTKSEAFRILSQKIERQKRIRRAQEQREREKHFANIIFLTVCALLGAFLYLTAV